MDINALMSAMLSSDSIKNMSQVTGASQKDVKNVLASALPSLLSGAQSQADDAGTVEGFAGALTDHAKADTTDIASFLSKVDLEDGGKIVSHLLGAEKDATTRKAAEAANVDAGKSGSILAAAAPLLMSLLGQQTAQESGQTGGATSSSAISGLMGALLSNVDVTSLLLGLLGGDSGSSSSSTAASGKKKKKKTSKKDESSGLLGNILNLLK